MKRRLEKGKIYIKSGYAPTSVSVQDSIYICYAGVGEAEIPELLMRKLQHLNQWELEKLWNNPIKLLFECVKYSQYINFEPIKD